MHEGLFHVPPEKPALLPQHAQLAAGAARQEGAIALPRKVGREAGRADGFRVLLRRALIRLEGGDADGAIFGGGCDVVSALQWRGGKREEGGKGKEQSEERQEDNSEPQ